MILAKAVELKDTATITLLTRPASEFHSTCPQRDETEAGQRSFNRRGESPAGFLERDGLDPPGIQVFHAPNDFLLPGGGDGFVRGIFQAFNQGSGQIRALRRIEGESLFQKFRSFAGHGVILRRTPGASIGGVLMLLARQANLLALRQVSFHTPSRIVDPRFRMEKS
jgi:hypothetical protein